MLRILCATTLLIAATSFIQRPALAYEAPWCAVINQGRDAHWDCQYRSIEECVPNVIAGNRGFCNQNPAYHGTERREPPAHRHIRRHVQQ